MPREITAKHVVRYGSIILLFVVIAGYGMWISRDLLFGIRLSVSGISDGMSAQAPLLDITGTARHANNVTLDGRTIPIAQSGAWSDTIALMPGYNVVTIGASDKFGRTKSRQYRVYYKAAVQ
jgi:hypothetical protein